MILHHLIRRPASLKTSGNKEKGTAARFRCGVFLVSALSAISGCASHDGIRVPDASTTVTNDQAFVLPPPGGPAIVNVIEHRSSNAVEQDIYLFTSASTPGQNVLKVTFFGPVGLDYDDHKDTAYKPVRDSDVSREMRRELPGVALARTPYYVQNNYGPFGYATGKSRSGDTCLYAWQQIRSNANSQSAFQNRGTIQLRLRLCDAHATEQQLLSVMYKYTITGTFPAEGWNPYDAPPKVDGTLGRGGNPIYPGAPSANVNQPPATFQTQAPASAAVVRARSGAARAQPVAQAPAVIARPIGPTVPSPLGGQQVQPGQMQNQQVQGLPAQGQTVQGQPGPRPVPVVVPAPGCATAAAEGNACR